MPKEYIKFHDDGSIWAKGQVEDGIMAGYWEWFRKDGTKMRSGCFDDGRQVGEWVTYDQQGKPVKTTDFNKKPKSSKPKSKKS